MICSLLLILIGELLSSADPVSKLIIGAYSHKAQHNINVKALSGSKFKTDHLEACTRFDGLKTRDENNCMIFTNKRTLADRVIMKVESLFPYTCQECCEEYQVKLDASLTNQRLQCFLCLQPSHHCEPLKASIQLLKDLPSKPAGNVWICNGCFDKNNPLLSNNHQKITASVTFENRTPNSSPAPQLPTQSPVLLNDQLLIETPQDTPGNELQQQTSPPTSPQQAAVPDTLENTVCQRYLTNQCPHGMNGNKLVNFGTKQRIGCQKGNSCPKFHPKLCRNSLRSSACYNDNCKFVHLK